MSFRLAMLSRWVLALAIVPLLAAGAAHAQVALPGDVYYTVHVNQRFQYYAFVTDVRIWENYDAAGTSLLGSAAHDTTELAGTLGISCAYEASAGRFTADLNTEMYMQARVGIFHLLTNEVRVNMYVRGPTGTPWWIKRTANGQALASRFNGLPGGLQPLNGESTATFVDSIAYTNTTGAVTKVDTFSTLEHGFSQAQIVVDGVTYSFARAYVLKAPAMMTQAVCILGCMTQAADFTTIAGGHVELELFPYLSPVSVPSASPSAAALMVRAAPNPLRSRSTITFRAPAGERASVRVFDVRGRLVTQLFEGTATGESQSLAWQPESRGAGLYFVQVCAAGQSATTKVARAD